LPFPRQRIICFMEPKSAFKRLRMEIIEGGLLTSTAIVNSATNHIKQNGLVIFNAAMQSLGRPVLLPYGKRIIKLAYTTSLQTSCSLPVRHAVDPTSSVRLDGKRKKWLHILLEMRAKAIETFHTMICTIGSNSLVTPLSSDTGKNRALPAGKGVTLVAQIWSKEDSMTVCDLSVAPRPCLG
jgi:hypothetical protein